MINTERCIICGRNSRDLDAKNPLTVEHIIPKALGNNSLICKFLCKSCNSKLGEKIDSDFINSFDIQLLRNQLRIGGRNGIPYPFKKGRDSDGHVIYVDENMQPRISPYVETNENSYSIHAGSREEAMKMAQKILSRKGVKKDSIKKVLESIEVTEIKEYKPVIQYSFEIDLRKRLLAILKIAYEYACFKLGDNYFNDDRAKEIRKLLLNEINNNNEDSKTKSIGVMFALEQMRPVLNVFNRVIPMYHLLIIQRNVYNQLLAIVSLFGKPELSFFVLLSNNASFVS